MKWLEKTYKQLQKYSLVIISIVILHLVLFYVLIHHL